MPVLGALAALRSREDRHQDLDLNSDVVRRRILLDWGYENEPETNIDWREERDAEGKLVRLTPLLIHAKSQTSSGPRAIARHMFEQRSRFIRTMTAQLQRKKKYGDDLVQTSCFVFDRESWLRQCCLHMVETPLFDKCILLLILLNSAAMAAYRHRAVYNKPMTDALCRSDPTTFGCGKEPDSLNEFIDVMDPIFLLVFIGECMAKVIAYGFAQGKHTYLRDAWNWLDFVVVITGIITWCLENFGDSGEEGSNAGSTIKMLRVFRVMRPLRSLTTLPELKVLVNTVLSSIPRLGSVLSMTLFLLVIFGILGLNLWMGVFERRCRTSGGVSWRTVSTPGCPIGAGEPGRWEWPLSLNDEGTPLSRPCGGRYMCEDTIGYHYFGEKTCGANSVFDLEETHQPDFPSSVTTAQGLVENFEDKYAAAKFAKWCANSDMDSAFYSRNNDASFNFGITNFNNILNAVIVIFQCITLEGWTDIMYMGQDAHGNDFAFIYFIFLVVIGSFFLLNVALAVVWDAFQELSGDQNAEEEEPEEAPPQVVAATSAVNVRRDGANGSLAALAAWSESPEKASAEPVNEASAGAENVNVAMAASPAGGREGSSVLNTSGTTASPGDDYTSQVAPGDSPPQRRVMSTALLVYEDEQKSKWAWDTASTPLFQNFVMLCIILNIVIMTMDSYPPLKPPLVGILDGFNTTFTIIFAVEMVVVLLAIGPVNYVKTNWHLLDGVIVVFSIIELFSGGGGALKSLRLLRIIKLAKKWQSFRLLLQAVIQTVMSMGNFTILLVLMMFVFALMGSLIFANKMKFHPDTDEPIPEDKPCPGGDEDFSCVRRAHFDYFLWSFVTVFQCLTGENWNAVMYDGMRGAGFAYFLFFFAMVVLGMCIIFNLFLAILMANFQDASDAIREAEDLRKEAEAMYDLEDLELEEGAEEGAAGEEEARGKMTGPIATYIARSDAKKEERAGSKPAEVRKVDVLMDPGAAGDASPMAPTATPQMEGAESPQSSATRKRGPSKRRRAGKKDSPYKEIKPDTHPFVRWCVAGCQSQTFDNFILAMIVVSSLAMAFDDPSLNPQAAHSQVLLYMNMVFTVIFTVEMIMKHVAMGVRSYWANGWNILDGLVVMVSVADLVFWFIAEFAGEDMGSDISFLKTLRILRALRPLRVIARNPNLKLVVNTIFASLPQLRTLMVLMLLFFLIVGLVALNYFKGAFYSCQGFDGLLPLRKAMDAAGTTATSDMCEYACAATEDCTQGTRLIKRPSGGCGAMPVYKRSGPDHPVCIAKCPSDRTGDGVCADYPYLATPTRKVNGETVTDLPDKCVRPSAASTAQNPQREDEWAGSQMSKGWRSALEYNLMQCTKCKTRYCPASEITQQCKDFCSDPLIGQCQTSCKHDADSGACRTCREECAAACSCEDNCRAMTEDAALCVEQGATTGGSLYKWAPSIPQSFDNIGTSMITLLEISTTEGWVDVMYAAVDARGIDLQPERDHTEAWSWFFVFFMLVGCFLILNLCVGVIVDNFAEMKKAQSNPGASLLVTPSQQKWIEAQKNLATRRMFLSLKNLEHYSAPRRKMFFFVNDDRFEGLIMLCILFNALVMAMKIYPDDPSGGDFDWVTYELVLTVLNYAFAGIFLIEAGLKLYAYRLWYFSDGWNLFDFSCVCATLVGIVLEYVFEVKVGALMSSIRLFRIARLLRLLRFAKGLNKIFNAFLLSIPKLFNVAMILFLLMFLYAVMGVQMFSKVQFSDFHNERGNFRTFYRGFMTLVRAMTGEAWNSLMHEMGRTAEDFGRIDGKPCVADFDVPTQAAYDLLKSKCLLENPIGCGAPTMSYIFWVTCTMFITFVVFNLVVAVILEGFEDSTAKSEEEIVNLAIDNWKKYDPDYKLELDVDAARKFIDEVSSELLEDDGKSNQELTPGEAEFLRLAGDAQGRVTFVQVVQGALRQVMLFSVDKEERSKMMDEIRTVEMGILDPMDPRSEVTGNILGALGYLTETDADGKGIFSSDGTGGT